MRTGQNYIGIKKGEIMRAKKQIPKEEVIKFLERENVKKARYIVITFTEKYFSDEEKEFPIGSIVSTKYLEEIKERVKHETIKKVIGLEYTDGLPDCPGGQFYSEE